MKKVVLLTVFCFFVFAQASFAEEWPPPPTFYEEGMKTATPVDDQRFITGKITPDEQTTGRSGDWYKLTNNSDYAEASVTITLYEPPGTDFYVNHAVHNEAYEYRPVAPQYWISPDSGTHTAWKVRSKKYTIPPGETLYFKVGGVASSLNYSLYIR